MRYVISDIHGEYDLFTELLDKINFTKRDVLYVCGDIVDKGDHSVKLADYISHMPNIKCIAGNHEYAFLKYYWGISRSLKDSGEVMKKLKGYFPDDGERLTWELVDWFESLPYFIEEEDFICVHAGVPLNKNGEMLPIREAIPEQLVYDRTFKDAGTVVKDGKCIFFGHTPSVYLTGGEGKILTYLRPGKSGGIVSDYYKVHLDIGCWLNGRLGCFCIDTCESTYVENPGKRI